MESIIIPIILVLLSTKVTNVNSIKTKLNQRKLNLFESKCSIASDNAVYVSSQFGHDSTTNGRSVEAPYASIQFAVDHREECQTIYVMEGVYRNKGYNISDNNGPVVNLNGVHNLKITNNGNDCVVIEFDGAGGFVGGKISNPVSNLEISGMEIIGSNKHISFEEAYANRLLPFRRYKGRGIAIWGGHHIHIHHMNVHHCPGSGIRVNNGDYVTIEESEVYSNSWWSSSAESAIVLAQSRSIDESINTKMSILQNKVYDNINKIPYYNKNYEWDYSPIAGNLNCTSYESCKVGLIDGCPWQCRYGKDSQDYIIDGSGVYVTRNSDTYMFGSFELSYNECYGNGINGLVFHRTNRGIIRQNVIYDNGRVPRLDKPEPIIKDWHRGCLGKSRQPYSGLVLNNANQIKLWSNRVSARYEDDYGFMQLDDNTLSPILAGGNNQICQGLFHILPKSAVNSQFNSSYCLLNQYPIDVLHSCRSVENYIEIQCGDNCHLIQWPYIMYESFPAEEAKDKCQYACDSSDCKAFSLQWDYDLNNGDRMCFLYLESQDPSPLNCDLDPFHSDNCSYPTVDGQFFITQDAAKRHNLRGIDC